MGIIYPLAEFGKKGELWAAEELRRRGYVVEWIGGNSDYDLLLGGCARVEVKSAMLTRDLRRGYRWQFSLRRHGLLVDEDVLFLLCWEGLEDGPPIAIFVIPGSAVDARLTKIEITSRDPRTYRGRWARYRGDWGQVRRVVERLPAQQPVLFREQVQERIPY